MCLQLRTARHLEGVLPRIHRKQIATDCSEVYPGAGGSGRTALDAFMESAADPFSLSHQRYGLPEPGEPRSKLLLLFHRIRADQEAACCAGKVLKLHVMNISYHLYISYTLYIVLQVLYITYSLLYNVHYTTDIVCYILYTTHGNLYIIES